MTNVLLLASHAVAEYDDVRMFHDAGFGIFAPGGYENPPQPGEGLRPALPDVPYLAELADACRRKREEHADEPATWAIDWAKADLAHEVVTWADVVIVHHFPEVWIPSNWYRLRGKRVIWRTCGQSDPRVEQVMAEWRAKGLQIVRYSPAERRFFERVGSFAGQDALIRFGKYPDDYGPWIGDDPVVGNLSQHNDKPHDRDEFINWGFWEQATRDLPVKFAGPHSEKIGGLGGLSYDAMREYLRHLRAYLYTGTRPASYTLALIEAMLSGVPVVSIGPERWLGGAADLYEGHAIVGHAHHDPSGATAELRGLLEDPLFASEWSEWIRGEGVRLFGIEGIAEQWREFLR